MMNLQYYHLEQKIIKFNSILCTSDNVTVNNKITLNNCTCHILLLKTTDAPHWYVDFDSGSGKYRFPIVLHKNIEWDPSPYTFSHTVDSLEGEYGWEL